MKNEKSLVLDCYTVNFSNSFGLTLGFLFLGLLTMAIEQVFYQ